MNVTARKARWIGRLGAAVLRVVGATWRIRLCGTAVDYESNEVLLAFLHGDMLIPAILYREIPAAIMISRHGDGELIARVVEHLGAHVPVRGSSSRGGARAFLEMVKQKGEMSWAITPDGPRGPRGSVGDGVVALASESGRPIYAAGFAVARGKHLGSWDRFVIPYPFTRIAAYVLGPLAVSAGLTKTERQRVAGELEDMLRRAHDEAVRALASW